MPTLISISERFTGNEEIKGIVKDSPIDVAKKMYKKVDLVQILS